MTNQMESVSKNKLDTTALREFYNCVWSRFIKDVPIDRGLSFPLFIDVLDTHKAARKHLMIVGKETNGWARGELGLFGSSCGPDPVASIQGVYRSFRIGEDYRRGHFFTAVRRLEEKVGQDVPHLGAIWSNLFPCSQRRSQKWGRPDSDIAEKLLGFQILPKEVRLLKPDAMVFFTGPSYDDAIGKLFPEAKFEPLHTKSGRFYSRVDHENLPKATFRTYHPNFFHRTGRIADLDRTLDSIAGAIRETS